MAVRRLTHLGLCVSDLERSLAFYTRVLGFAEVGRFVDDQGYGGKLLELPEARMTAVYLERDGWRIELLYYAQPGHIGTPERRPMNQIGLTHLSFVVEDLDETCAAIAAHGGAVVEETRLEMQSRAIFATDPDGIRLEIIERAGDPLIIPGQSPKSG